MKELRFDFRESATRASIAGQLSERLEQEGLGAGIEAAVVSAGVPPRHHRDLADVLRTVGSLRGVSEAVRTRMRDIYTILAQAEARAHGVAVEETHFHEVGNAAGIEGVLRVCLMVEELAPQRIVSTPVQLGSGTVHCAHGELDIPAPATAAIVARGIPVCEERLEGELCTPTSAAMILHLTDSFEG